MKRFFIVCVSIVAVLTLSLPAIAQENSRGVYVGVLGGLTLPTPMSFNITDRTNSENDQGDISMKKGWLGGAKVGYLTPFTNRILAVELEYNHLESNFDSRKQYEGGTLDGRVKADVMMVNLIGRCPSGKFHPYVGVGGGYANMKVGDISGMDSQTNTKEPTIQGGGQGVFAYQVLVGVDYDINKNWMVGLGYKYLATNPVSFNTTATSANGNQSVSADVNAKFSAHNILLTVGYLF